jgi:hypothetical protein
MLKLMSSLAVSSIMCVGALVGALETLQADAAKLRPLAKSDLTRSFLEATAALPVIEPRVVWRTADKSKAITDDAYRVLSESDRSAFAKRDCDATFYWNTGYGSPLAYLRPLDILAANGVSDVRGKRIADFGYGTIGHLRLLASNGADMHGIDIEPLFAALYSAPGDTGTIKGLGGAPSGSIALHTGQWPADAALATEVGGGFDVFMSKNTLKRGYIHPAREADPKRLVHLGVDDEAFLRTVHASVKPGGLFLIYNICPAQAPADQPYIPHADGQCPFDRALLEKVGFEVIAFDVNDFEALAPVWHALGYDEGKDDAALKKELFVWYTLARRK